MKFGNLRRVVTIFAGLAVVAVVFIAMLFVVASQPAPPVPEAPVAQTPAEVRVKAVERNVETLDFGNAEAAKSPKLAPRRTSMEFGILSPETA